MAGSKGTTVYRKDYTPPAFLVDSTALTFQLDETATQVSAELTMRRNPAAEKTAPLFLNGEKLELKSIALDGQPLSANQYTVDDHGLTVHNVPEQFTLSTTVTINPKANTALEGLYRDSGGMLCTQCEAQGFRRITYFPDRPDVLSKFTVRLEGDVKQYPVLLSNGNPVGQGKLDGGKRHYAIWQDPFPKPCYLFAVVAGDLKFIEDTFTTQSGRPVTLRLFTEEHNLPKTTYAMGALKRAMKWDEEAFGREYDLDLFMIVAVDAFNMGAMENKGLNIFNASLILATPETATDDTFMRIEGVVGHEYFHNWSGNRVTCRSWFELSLKEGFTVFRDASFSGTMNDPASKRIEDVALLRARQFPEDAGPLAHPIRPESYQAIDNFYTATVYEKGAEIIRMQQTILGKSPFRKGTDLYFKRHDGQAVTCEDFVKALEDASGRDLKQFRNWYAQAGTPVVDVEGTYNPSAQTYTMKLTQRTDPTPGQAEKPAFHIPVKMALVDENGHDILLKSTSSAFDENTGVIHLTEREQTVTFINITKETVPSLLRGFSAPVKLNFPYSRQQLTFLAGHDHDGFARWEAGQKLAVDIIHDLMDEARAGNDLAVDPLLAQAARHTLESALEGTLSPALAALALTLPAEDYLAELREHVDLEGIQHMRDKAANALAHSLSPLWKQTYEAMATREPYAPTAEQIGRRRLKNVALAYLMRTKAPAAVELCEKQFATADNMTDQSAALTLLVDYAPEAVATKALEAFYTRFKDQPLVVDIWLRTQARCPRAGGLAKVKALVSHPAYSNKRPNSVRAVLGAFGASGVENFHGADGSGYQWFAEQLLALDKINPQITARLSAPLTKWKRLDPARAKHMQAALATMAADKALSANTREMVEKALNA